MSKKPMHDEAPSADRGNGLSLSGKALIELMRAVHAKGRPFRFRAGGHSMAPFIRDGDVICLAPLTAREPGAGDVAAFIHPGTGRLCVHRVLSVKGNRYLIRGDNLPEKPDGRVPREAILGRVTIVERTGRRVRMGLGPERRVIAFLSRCGALTLMRRLAGPLHACRSRSPASCAKR